MCRIVVYILRTTCWLILRHVKHLCVCVCLCLGSLFEGMDEMGGPTLMVTERLGKKRLHSGKTFSCDVDTSGCSFVLITCLYF